MLTLTELKAKSVKHLAGLIPVVAAAAERLIERSYARGVQIIITQGYRSIAEQDALYAQGRTKPGQIVTNARGGTSYHNYGVAIDFALLLPDGRTASWDTRRDDDRDGKADWMEVVEEAKALGFEWGGDFKTFMDMPHFQMTFGLTCSQYRAGKLPPAALVSAAYAKINPFEEDAPMTKEERAEFATLQKLTKEQAGQIKAMADKLLTIEARQIIKEPPAWAQEAVQAAVNYGLIDTPNGGSYDFYRLLTVLHRKGVI